MKLLGLFFCLVFGGNSARRRRFQGFHDKRFIEIDPSAYETPEHQDEIDPKLQSLIDSMIINRRKISIGDFTAWNLYKNNLNS